jgi:hypothetical protein
MRVFNRLNQDPPKVPLSGSLKLRRPEFITAPVPKAITPYRVIIVFEVVYYKLNYCTVGAVINKNGTD